MGERTDNTVVTVQTHYRWYLVAFLFWIVALNYADRTAISAVFPLIRIDLEMSDVALAAVGSLFFWSYAIGSPLAGYTADRLSRSRIIVGSLALWSLITLLTGFVTDLRQLLFLRVLLGLAECAYLPAAIALIADYHAPETRATAMSIHHAGLTLGPVLGGALSGYLADQFGWRLGFYVLGGGGLALAAVAGLTVHDAPASGPGTGQPRSSDDRTYSALRTISILFRIPSYVILITQAMLIAVGMLMFLNWLPLYFQETFQMSLAGAGFSGTFFIQVAATIGIIVGGRFSDRLCAKRLHRRMFLQSVFTFAAAPFLLAFVGTPSYGFLNVAIFLFAFLLFFGASNENAIMCELLSPRLRSSAAGIRNMTNCFGGGVGILVAGYLKQDYGLGSVFACFSAIVLAAAFLLLIGYLFFVRKDLSLHSTDRSEFERLAVAGRGQSPGCSENPLPAAGSPNPNDDR